LSGSYDSIKDSTALRRGSDDAAILSGNGKIITGNMNLSEWCETDTYCRYQLLIRSYKNI
jgi:hypothetical protein